VQTSTLHYPLSDKSGCMYDNSPALGFQAVAMAKHILRGTRPVRNPKDKYSLDAAPTASPEVKAYPFRGKDRAVVVLLARERRANRRRWSIEGLDLGLCRPLGIYAANLTKMENGVLKAPELPVYLETEPRKLAPLLENLAKAKISPVRGSQMQRLALGPYVVEIDPERQGIIKVLLNKDGKELTLISGMEAEPALGKPEVTVVNGRLVSQAQLWFNHPPEGTKYRYLAAKVSRDGCQLTWTYRHVYPGTAAESNVRFVLGADAVKAAKAGLYGQGRSVSLGNLATIALPQGMGTGEFTPKSGLVLDLKGPQPALTAKHRVQSTTKHRKPKLYLNAYITTPAE